MLVGVAIIDTELGVPDDLWLDGVPGSLRLEVFSELSLTADVDVDGSGLGITSSGSSPTTSSMSETIMI